MEKTIEKKYQEWINNTDKKYLLELKKLSIEEKIDKFSSEISFGTAGIRGKILLGTNYINEYTVSKFSYCYGLVLANLKENFKQGVAIFHDNRKLGREFSTKAARILSAMGIKVYFYENNEPSSTPLLSYVIIKKKLIGGINITASHNGKEYSGMKFYDSYGKQIGIEHINLFKEYSKKTNTYFNFPEDDKNIYYFNENLSKEYIKDLLNSFNLNYEKKKNFKVIYSSNHGAGIKIANQILKDLKYDYEIVKEQSNFDENFTNSKIPNPQYEESFYLSKKYGNKYNADILISSDPDADRIGVMVKQNEKWALITGNELPIIQMIYLIKEKEKNQSFDFSNHFVVNSIVTSNYLFDIFDKYKIKHYSTITGFSSISNLAKETIDNNSSMIPFFLWEESNGAILNFDLVHDKDFFQNLVNVLFIAYDLKINHDKSLLDYLDDIKKEYGYFFTDLKTINIENGKNKDLYKNIKVNIVNILKENKSKEFPVKEIIDYENSEDPILNKEIIEIVFENNSNIFIRNSGTEPLLKIYVNLKNKDEKKLSEHKIFVDFLMDKILI